MEGRQRQGWNADLLLPFLFYTKIVARTWGTEVALSTLQYSQAAISAAQVLHFEELYAAEF